MVAQIGINFIITVNFFCYSQANVHNRISAINSLVDETYKASEEAKIKLTNASSDYVDAKNGYEKLSK